jgi:hypothetical protein
MTDAGGGPITRIGQSLISNLPPAFILLFILNLSFLGFIVWFLEAQLTQRDAMAERLFNRCMEIALKEAP